MFQYFDVQQINNYNIIDIWKNFSVSIDTEDYIFHTLSDGDNLMKISYEYYNTVDNWWIIYIFNNLENINFDLLTNSTIQATLSKYKEDINNYENLSKVRKKYINATLRDYFINTYTPINLAYEKLYEFLFSIDELELKDFLIYIENLMITESYYNTKIKIPSSSVVSEIKNQFEDLSEVWEEQNLINS